MMTPDEMSPDRSAKLATWKRNRDHCAGTDAVKGARETYCERSSDVAGRPITNTQYQSFLDSVEYYPAAARNLQSYRGLAFRKAPVLKAPEKIQRREYTITAKGDSLLKISRQAFREYAVTNDGGILVDYTETPEGASVADVQAIDAGSYLSLYKAESIREITYGQVNGVKRLISVRLLDDENTARHLELRGGVYTVTIFRRGENGWSASRTVPLANGKPLTFIPFVHLHDDEDDGAAMDDLCAENQTHYRHKAWLALAMKHIVNPIRVITGLSEDVELPNRAGAVWRFDDPETKVDYHVYKGEGVPHLKAEIKDIEQHMTELGSQMLISQAAPSESVETTARRAASQDSILAAMLTHVIRCVERALEFMAVWEGVNPDEVEYAGNTNFIPANIDPQVLQQAFNMVTAGKLTLRAFFELLQRYDLINEATTFERYEDDLEKEVIDKPVTAPASFGSTAPVSDANGE